MKGKSTQIPHAFETADVSDVIGHSKKLRTVVDCQLWEVTRIVDDVSEISGGIMTLDMKVTKEQASAAFWHITKEVCCSQMVCVDSNEGRRHARGTVKLIHTCMMV